MPTDVYIYESRCSKVGESKSIVGCTLKESQTVKVGRLIGFNWVPRWHNIGEKPAELYYIYTYINAGYSYTKFSHGTVCWVCYRVQVLV